MDLIQLSNIAIKAAYSAGKIIQLNMDSDILVEKKETGTSYASQVVTKVDKECETAILSYLLPTCNAFDLALLSDCLLYTSPSPRDKRQSRMPSSA